MVRHCCRCGCGALGLHRDRNRHWCSDVVQGVVHLELVECDGWGWVCDGRSDELARGATGLVRECVVVWLVQRSDKLVALSKVVGERSKELALLLRGVVEKELSKWRLGCEHQSDGVLKRKQEVLTKGRLVEGGRGWGKQGSFRK